MFLQSMNIVKSDLIIKSNLMSSPYDSFPINYSRNCPMGEKTTQELRDLGEVFLSTALNTPDSS